MSTSGVRPLPDGPDPAVPPIPPHATWSQIEHAVEAIARGDSDRADVVKQGLKAKMADFLPGGPT